MGPRIPQEGGNADYYCSQAVSVTIAYGVRVPFWDFLGALFGGPGNTNLQEIGIATRLGRDYEVTPAGNSGYHD
jgi:hypothetical protein